MVLQPVHFLVSTMKATHEMVTLDPHSSQHKFLMAMETKFDTWYLASGTESPVLFYSKIYMWA